jgi:hypothetical protein
MPGRLAIVQGHPDPAGNHLCHALADAYADGALSAGHQVSRIEITRIDFPLLRTQQEFEIGPLPETLVPARDALVAAQHILIVFPLWHGTMPALLKAFIEQVMRPGVALEVSKRWVPAKVARGTFGTPCRHDGHAGTGLSLVFPRPWGTRAGAERTQVSRHEAGSRNAIRNGAVGGRRPTSTLVGSNEEAGTAASLITGRRSSSILSSRDAVN